MRAAGDIRDELFGGEGRGELFEINTTALLEEYSELVGLFKVSESIYLYFPPLSQLLYHF